jgi:predicted phosphohydrolase
LSDPHLNRTAATGGRRLLARLRQLNYDAAVVTGDISDAAGLSGHLRQIARACAPGPVFFVLGNHDFYGSGFAEVDAEMDALCRTVPNLHHLDGRAVIPLGNEVGLIGHRGWADARAGYGSGTVIDSPDRHRIAEFRGMGRPAAFGLMRELGMESARRIRATLPLALSCHRHVVIATHVPPYAASVRRDGRPCAATHMPHFVNLSAGLAINSITRAYPGRHVTVLAGHSHEANTTRILHNLTARVASPCTRRPGLLPILSIS